MLFLYCFYHLFFHYTKSCWKCRKKLVFMKIKLSESLLMKSKFFNITFLFLWIKKSICAMSRKSTSKQTSTNIKITSKLLSKDSVWMPHSRQQIHKNVSILSEHILALNKLEKIFNKPQLNWNQTSKLECKKWKPKQNKRKRISKKVPSKWSKVHKKNGKKENNKSNKLPMNLEFFKTSHKLFPKDGKRSNKFHIKFMMLQHKKYIKWLLHLLSKRLIRQNKISSKEQETSNKVQKKLERTFKENMRKENMKLKKQQECNQKNLFIKMWSKVQLKAGKT